MTRLLTTALLTIACTANASAISPRAFAPLTPTPITTTVANDTARPWGNHELNAGGQSMCKMGTQLNGDTIAVTFQPGRNLLLQLFRPQWAFAGLGPHDPNPRIKVQFSGNGVDYWIRGDANAHFVAGQGILNFPIAHKNAADFIKSLDNATQLTVTFIDGPATFSGPTYVQAPWTTNTPGVGPATDAFEACVLRHGGIRPTAWDRGTGMSF